MDTLPLSLSVFAYGLAYGALANNTNDLTLVQTLAMSLIAFSGAGQFSMLALMQQGAAFWTIVGSVFLINSRHILYGLTLGQSLRTVPARHLIWLSHILSDESYSVAAVRTQKGPLRISYFAGAGLTIFLAWLLSGAIGFQLGDFITDPAAYGLDFAFVGAFLGLLAAQLKHRRHLIAALAAAGAAVLVYGWFGTSGAVFAGALIAFMMGVYGK
jgi:predicted branched-subunit amino acid permease